MLPFRLNQSRRTACVVVVHRLPQLESILTSLCICRCCCWQTLISEVLLKAGEVLYVPTQWFHYISNIGVNAQCNRQVTTTPRGVETNEALVEPLLYNTVVTVTREDVVFPSCSCFGSTCPPSIFSSVLALRSQPADCVFFTGRAIVCVPTTPVSGSRWRTHLCSCFLLFAELPHGVAAFRLPRMCSKVLSDKRNSQ